MNNIIIGRQQCFDAYLVGTRALNVVVAVAGGASYVRVLYTTRIANRRVVGDCSARARAYSPLAPLPPSAADSTSADLSSASSLSQGRIRSRGVLQAPEHTHQSVDATRLEWFLCLTAVPFYVAQPVEGCHE